MNTVQLKIQQDAPLASAVKILRAFDSSLTIGEIKSKIENHDFVITFDLNHYDVVEELQGVDRKALFRDMIRKLGEAGAQVSVYLNGETASIAQLDNWLGTMREIAQEAEESIDREAGCFTKTTPKENMT